MPARAATLRELEQLAKSDIAALRVVLSSEAGRLEGRLGVAPGRTSDLLELDDEALAESARRLVRSSRQDGRQKQLRELRDKAELAARQLVREAIWASDGQVHLDPRRLLGPLLSCPRDEYLAFHLDDSVIIVRRATLLAARKALSKLPALTASVDSEALRFRWRQRKGGLNLTSQELPSKKRDRVLRIVLDKPTARERAFRPSVVLSSAITELGFAT